MPRAAEAFAAAIMPEPAPAGENIAIERTTAPGGEFPPTAPGRRPRPGFKPQMKNASDRGDTARGAAKASEPDRVPVCEAQRDKVALAPARVG